MFSTGEMQEVIDHYAYGSLSITDSDADRRQSFIRDALRADRPVLIPYWCDDYGYPTDSDKEPGAHWSVIFDKGGGEYHYINPWYPERER